MKTWISSFSVRAFLLFASVLLLSQSSFAQDAGCGLGSVVFKQNTRLIQLFALTTNYSTATQFFGITTGTSGCRASGLVMNEKAVQYFAEVNKDDLSREMAQGGGEKLATLASLYGCQSDEARGEFAHMTQNSYERIFPKADTSPSGMLQNLNREIQSHAELAQRCQAI